jgi:hypothetical protein
MLHPLKTLNLPWYEPAYLFFASSSHCWCSPKCHSFSALHFSFASSKSTAALFFWRKAAISSCFSSILNAFFFQKSYEISSWGHSFEIIWGQFLILCKCKACIKWEINPWNTLPSIDQFRLANSLSNLVTDRVVRYFPCSLLAAPL